MLFKTLFKPDRQQTQLAYRVKYWPYHELSDAARKLISYKKTCYLSKDMIESNCDEAKTTLFWKERSYKIVWAFNNPPTEQEWRNKTDRFHIRAEFRSSPAIPEFAVVILNFELISDKLRATFPGEML